MHHSSPQIHQYMPPCPGLMPSGPLAMQALVVVCSSPWRNDFTQQKNHHDKISQKVSVWSPKYSNTVLKSFLFHNFYNLQVIW